MNMFANAKTVDAAPIPTKGKKKSVEIVNQQAAELAALDAAEKAIKAQKAVAEAYIKASAKTQHIQDGLNRGTAESFYYVSEEGDRVNMQARKRSSASALTDEEVEMLEVAGLPYETQITQTELYGFNPEYIKDQDMMQRISDALSGIEGLPSDIIVRVPEKSKRIVTDDTVKALWQTTGIDHQALMSVVMTQAVRCTPGPQTTNGLWQRLVGLFGNRSGAENNEKPRKTATKRAR